jgi:hypothetical protein
MKKLLLVWVFIFLFATFAYAIEEDSNVTSNSVIRLQCKGDQIKRTRNNEVAGTIFTFTLKDNKLYGREGELISNAVITDEEIKGKLKYKHGLSWENTRFQINRYTGAFNYHTIYRTLENVTDIRNSGMCSKVSNERAF